MQPSEQISQVKLLLARLDSGTTVDAGGIRHNPTSVYADPDLAGREWEAFFAHHPQLVGLSGDLPEPGSFLTLDELGSPILATRDPQGAFRAFVNSCRHRGAVVVEQPRGTAKRFLCPFHNWCYDTTGSLVNVPKQEHFGEVDRSCHGLIELPAVERDGLLWVHPDPSGTIDLDGQLGEELSSELAHWDLGGLDYLGEDSYDVECNWKLAMDTFGETYHFPVLHANTLNLVFHGNVQCYDTYGSNHRMILCRREIDQMRHLPEDEWSITRAALPVYWLFPNVQLLPFEEGLQLVRAYPEPGHPGRHTSRISFYLRHGAAADAAQTEVFRMMAQRFGEIIRDEDYVMSASQQRTADGGIVPHVVFGRNEPALHHYHQTYRSRLAMDPLPLLEA